MVGASIATWNAGGGGDGDVAVVLVAVAGHVGMERVVTAVVVSKVQA